MSYLGVGPESVTHRHSGSKTRVNALVVLRRIRGTLHTAFAGYDSSPALGLRLRHGV